MNLSGVVAVSGKPGLFKVLGQNKAGFLLEALEGDGSKVMVSNNARLAALDETTVYGIEEDLLLRDILQSIQLKEKELSLPEVKSDPEVLRQFFLKICPNHDQDRVYTSDLKKIISWYKIIEKLPIFLEPSAQEKEKNNSKEVSSGENKVENPNMDGPNPVEVAKSVKKASSGKGKKSVTHEKDLSIGTKGSTKNVTHAVRKVNTGANKKAK